MKKNKIDEVWTEIGLIKADIQCLLYEKEKEKEDKESAGLFLIAFVCFLGGIFFFWLWTT